MIRDIRQVFKWLWLIILLLPTQLLASKATFEFTNIGFEQGLKAAVIDILQDQQGFIWVATQDGLYRYDGYDFKVFRHDPDDPTTLAGNYIQSLFQDSKGVLWVGTHNGLSYYNSVKGTFVHYKNQPNSPTNLSNNIVTSTIEAQNGDLWIGTLGGGLNHFNPNTKTFTHYRHDPKDSTSLSDDKVYTVLQDSQGFIWAGTRNGGLNRLDTKTGQFIRYQHNPNKPDSLSHNKVFTLYKDKSSTLWVGTRDGGLNRFDRKTESFVHYRHDADDADSLGSDHVYAIFEDKAGSLWVGAHNGGLNRFDKTNNRFYRYKNNPQDKTSVPDDDVWSIIQDQTGLIWLGTFGGGISHFDPSSERFGLIKHDANNPQSLSEGGINAIYKDKADTLWIGTTSGLNRYNKTTGQFKRYQHNPDNPHSLSDNDVRSILEDAAGNLWIGTLNGGLNLLNRQTNTFVHYRHNANDTNSVTDGFISIIHEDSLGHLWIGTANGLNRYNPISKNFTRFTHVADDPTSISHNTIYALYTAQDGSLWVGTGGGGLNHFNHQSQTFTRYQHNPDNANSLSHNTVYSIDQDPQGNFWIGTDGGLNRFDAKTNAFTHYREKDGLPSDSVLTVQGDKNGNLWLGAGGISLFDPTSATFRNGIGASAGCSSGGQGANYQATDGKLYFGHCSFYPSQAIVPSQPPQVVFTDFRLLNKSVAINGDNSPTVLTQVINQTEAITLSHEDNILSFEFAALHYVDPKKNKYRYKLDGFNKDWIETAADNRRATFTNLAAGDYTFRVKASNHKGVWSEQDRSIKLTVTPAPWFTWWAKSFYVLVAFSLFGTVVYLNHLRHRAIIRSQQNAELANQAKSIFVANISHEIRTPLNAVLGYTQMLEREPGLADQYKQKISIIDRSGHHLLALINDILDISKMEANAMELHEVDFELVDLIEGIAVMFDGRCAEKHLDWRFVNQVDNHIAVHGDQGKLRQILINLLGNAVKFTAKGSVTLTLSCQNPDHYHFEVADSGIGIALHEQVSIFRAFSQTTEGAKHGGTGLGLAIASKQVKLMGGQLKLTSTINQGSQFYFTLPLAKADVAIEARHSRQLHAIKLAPGVNVSALVVDDVKENRDILTHMLQDVGITVLIAQNGQDALDKLHQADSETEGLPDLIFMDVRMPLMDGVQAFKHIQQDFKDRCPTCIVVTAHAMQSDVEHYLHQGFDHYIAKPFRFEAIYECIHHLLDVDFLYENEDEDEPAQAADTTDFCIPPALYQSIKRSADEYEVSKLEDCLIELGNMGTPGKQLADTLNKYLASYDMTGLLEQLSKLKVKQKAQLSTTSC